MNICQSKRPPSPQLKRHLGIMASSAGMLGSQRESHLGFGSAWRIHHPNPSMVPLYCISSSHYPPRKKDISRVAFAGEAMGAVSYTTSVGSTRSSCSLYLKYMFRGVFILGNLAGNPLAERSLVVGVSRVTLGPSQAIFGN
jgi:hypothetical protein